MQSYICIYPICCLFDVFCTRNFLRLVIPLKKTLKSKSSTPQALNNASTVGGPVAVWMPSQLAEPTSGWRPPADEPTSGCCEDFVCLLNLWICANCFHMLMRLTAIWGGGWCHHPATLRGLNQYCVFSANMGVWKGWHCILRYLTGDGHQPQDWAHDAQRGFYQSIWIWYIQIR